MLHFTTVPLPAPVQRKECRRAAQLIVVNAVFLLYAALGYDWAPPAGVVQVWLAATFVQVVSVVVVIARSLFPHEDSGRKRV